MPGPDLGMFRAEAATRLVGTLALMATIVVYAMALEALRRTETGGEDDDKRVWYLGYTRDFTNTLGVVLFWLSHYLLGFPLHLALAAGSATTLVAYLLDYAFARALKLGRRTGVLIAAMVIVTLPTQLSPHRVCDGFGRLIATLFG
ncbi:MAG: hypothetical protein HY906_27665 [Deltaproteobacteria bacterium]|nr:hypothetical protein [Deltaproteobacteria bacterium]